MRTRDSIHRKRSPFFGPERFTYEPENNRYICPAGQFLNYGGRVYRNRAFNYQCCLPGSYHPPERTSPTTCAGVGQHARVRQSTTAKKESGSLVRGTEEPDRIAALASAETQVRARAVLPGSGSSEHQATGALPQPTQNTYCTTCHLVEMKGKTRQQRSSQPKRHSDHGLFQHPQAIITRNREPLVFRRAGLHQPRISTLDFATDSRTRRKASGKALTKSVATSECSPMLSRATSPARPWR